MDENQLLANKSSSNVATTMLKADKDDMNNIRINSASGVANSKSGRYDKQRQI